MLTDLYQFHSRALQQPRSASFPWHFWRNYLDVSPRISLSFSMEMRKAYQTHFTPAFPCHWTHWLLSSSLLFITSAETPSWVDSITQWIQPMLENCCVSACMYSSLKQYQWNRRKPWYKLCFYGACNHPTNHSSSTRRAQAQTGPMLNWSRCKDLPVSEPESDRGFGRNWKSCHLINIQQAHTDTAHFSSVTMVL